MPAPRQRRPAPTPFASARKAAPRTLTLTLTLTLTRLATVTPPLVGTALGILLVWGSSARAAPAAPSSTTSGPGAISAEISGLRNDRGTVFCTLYASEDGFPMDGSKALRRTTARPKDGKATCAFPDLPPGTYAVGLLHDENDNGKMDTNFVGLPKEGYGASNDARSTFGPPKFKDAKVELKGGVLDLRIKARYLL